MKILIDNGHGENTAGKRSPDGRLREYSYAREIAERVEVELRHRGYDAERIVRENTDVPLTERVLRVNDWCNRLTAKNVLVVSIHCNAAGDGRNWASGNGWEAWTSVGQTKSDHLAECLYQAAHKILVGHRIRTDKADGDSDKESQFYILRKTKCAAVLTENFFQDNLEDVRYMLSEEGKNAVVRVHVEGIINFIEKQ